MLIDNFNKKGSFNDDIFCEPSSSRNNHSKIKEILEMVDLKINEYNLSLNSNNDDDEDNDN